MYHGGTQFTYIVTYLQTPRPPPTNLQISLKSKVNTDWYAEPGVLVGSGEDDSLRSELAVPDNVVGPDIITATVQGKFKIINLSIRNLLNIIKL